MFTLDEIKTILDAEEYASIEGYNLIRTNLMSQASSAITEMDAANAAIKRLEEENAKLKQANMTLYSRIESNIMHKEPDEEDKDEEGGEPDYDEEKELEANIKAYAEI